MSEPDLQAEDPRVERILDAVIRLGFRLFYLALMALGAYAAYRSASAEGASWWVPYVVLLSSAWVAGNRPLIGTIVVLVAAFIEWMTWAYGPGLGPLPATVATLLAPTLIVGALNLCKPPVPEATRQAGGEAAFPRIVVLLTSLFVVWIFGWAQTL